MSVLQAPQWLVDEGIQLLRRSIEGQSALIRQHSTPMTRFEREAAERRWDEAHAAELKAQHEAMAGTVEVVERIDTGYVLHYADGRRVTLYGAGDDDIGYEVTR
jgi:hypothetical protein